MVAVLHFLLWLKCKSVEGRVGKGRGGKCAGKFVLILYRGGLESSRVAFAVECEECDNSFFRTLEKLKGRDGGGINPIFESSLGNTRGTDGSISFVPVCEGNNLS